MKNETLHINVIKTGNCSSRSGLSQLTYQIGQGPESEIHFRIHGNTGKGFFNDEWLLLDTLLNLLKEAGSGFTSFAFYPLLKGRSSNTAAFIMAALLNEGLVMTSVKHKRCYEMGNIDKFNESVKALVVGNKGTKKKAVEAD